MSQRGRRPILRGPNEESAHIRKWVDFYEAFFPTREAATHFVAACETRGPAARASMLIMHQTQRLVSLADEIIQLRHRDPLALLFLLILAEAVAKLRNGASSKGKSRSFTRKFFNDFVARSDQEQLESGFVGGDEDGLDHPLDLTAIVDRLYEIRCDVVHEGRYWDFFFSTSEFTSVTRDLRLGVSISYQRFRDIIVRGAIAAAHSALPTPLPG